MRSAIAFLIGLLSGACAAHSAPAVEPLTSVSPAPAPLAAEQVAERARAATVIVWNGHGTCAGVWVGAETVLTAAHCASAPGAPLWYAVSGGTAHQAHAIAVDDARDLMVLEAQGTPDHGVARVRVTTARVGEPVYTMGHPYGHRYSFSAGIVSALRTSTQAAHLLDGVRLVQTDAMTAPGNSGGGLFDSNGDLVGIGQGAIAEHAARCGYFVAIGEASSLLR